MTYPSHVVRNAKRSALRNHPDAEKVLAGRLVSSLSKAELDTALISLGISPDAIENAADLAFPVSASCDNTPQDEDATPRSPVTEDLMVEAQVQRIRSLIVQGGFSALDDKLRALVTEARKPPVEIIREVFTEATPGAPVHCAKPTGRKDTWRNLFDVRGTIGNRETALWDGSHPSTPTLDPLYVWPQPQTATILSQLGRGRNVYLFGPAGTGKTQFAEQLAARTGRPFALISCDTGTDAATLLGMTVPDPSGGVSWQDGQLTRAVKTPGCVICIDEPSVARPGALFVLQNVLANRVLYVAETGARIPVASGVLFIATDNTNGTGGGGRRGYTDTNRLNAAFLDRFGVRTKFDYLPADKEAQVIVDRTGCTPELAKLLVQGAAVTRAAANDQTLSHGIGLRRLLSWAELLTDGIDPMVAFHAAVLDTVPEQDVETLREQLLLTYDAAKVRAALNPTAAAPPAAIDPALSNPTPAGRSAASDFTAS